MELTLKHASVNQFGELSTVNARARAASVNQFGELSTVNARARARVCVCVCVCVFPYIIHI